MAPKLRPMEPLKDHKMPKKEIEEIVVGNIKVGRDGIVLVGAEVDNAVAPSVHLDQLEKKRALGQGKQGTVSQYVKKDDRSISYAVKKISIPNTTDPKQMQSIGSELSNIFAEENEYTIKLFNAFYRSHHLYLVMEYMNWGNLEELCNSTPKLPETVAAYLAGQILHSLALLHRKHVVGGTDGKEMRQIHRDIKPANVLLSCEGKVKLADFGVAASADTVGASSFVGSVTYMSPERIRGGKHGPPSDVWSVGVLVVQILKGEYPFGGPNASFMTILKDVANFSSMDLSELGVSPSCCDFVGKCLQQKEDDRWAAEQLLGHEWVTANESTGKEELRRLLEATGDITLHRAHTSLTSDELPPSAATKPNS